MDRFDERFRGYGYNKIVFFLQLYALGFRFWVLPQHFLVEVPHPPSNDYQRRHGYELSCFVAVVKPPLFHSPQKDPCLLIKTRALYNCAKREISLHQNSTIDLDFHDNRSRKPSDIISSGFVSQFRGRCDSMMVTHWNMQPSKKPHNWENSTHPEVFRVRLPKRKRSSVVTTNSNTHGTRTGGINLKRFFPANHHHHPTTSSSQHN